VRVAVVGGGITGLAAAWEAMGREAEVTVFEAGDTWGGKLRTTPLAGRPVDEGADAFLARVPEATALATELGLGAQLVSPAASAACVWADGRLHRLPDGLVLGVPTDLDVAATSTLLRRPVVERDVEPLAPGDDPTVGELVRTRLGDEVLDRLVGPLIGGINAGDADRLSARAVTPQLAAAAERDRSIVRALRAEREAAAGGPVFHSVTGGTGALVEALVAALGAAGAHLRLRSPVDRLDDLDADAVVVTTPARAAAALVDGVAPDAATLLRTIEYASVVIVSVAVDAGALDLPAGVSGFLVPRTEPMLVTACSFASNKWPHLGGDTAVLRASAGRHGDDRAVELDDDRLVDAVLADLRRTIGLTAAPVEVRVSRWPRSFPQYAPGHLALVDRVDRALADAAAGPPIAVAGAGLRGLGIPACIRQGRGAIARVLGVQLPS
jgi:oxygen-dependent protoporphyrinogen oxidase